jgi:hypothetical protein
MKKVTGLYLPAVKIHGSNFHSYSQPPPSTPSPLQILRFSRNYVGSTVRGAPPLPPAWYLSVQACQYGPLGAGTLSLSPGMPVRPLARWGTCMAVQLMGTGYLSLRGGGLHS